MFKKILFTALAALMIYSTAVVSYRIFEPKLDTSSPDEHEYIEYDSLNEYILSTGEGAIHYFYLYSSINQDCVYIKNTVLAAVQNDTKIEIDKVIETVDITSLEKSMNISRLSSEWGINAYPAFMAVSMKDGVPAVDNKLEWDPEHMISVRDIEQWLIDNGLYIGTVQETEQVQMPEG